MNELTAALFIIHFDDWLLIVCRSTGKIADLKKRLFKITTILVLFQIITI